MLSVFVFELYFIFTVTKFFNTFRFSTGSPNSRNIMTLTKVSSQEKTPLTVSGEASHPKTSSPARGLGTRNRSLTARILEAMANGYIKGDIRRKKEEMAAVDGVRGIRLVVDLTMYPAQTSDLQALHESDATTSEQLAVRRRSARKERPTVKALEAIVDSQSRANKRNKKDREQ